MDDGQASGYTDPPEEAPWAMQFVVRVERSARPTVNDACAAAGSATVRLLDEAGTHEGWQPAASSCR